MMETFLDQINLRKLKLKLFFLSLVKPKNKELLSKQEVVHVFRVLNFFAVRKRSLPFFLQRK